MGLAAARQTNQVPTTLTSRQVRRVATSSSSRVPLAWTLALVTSTSSRPWSVSTRSTRLATECSSVTSQLWPCTIRPVWADNVAAICRQRSPERLASTTSEPASATAVAIARPRPVAPPVTSVTCPVRGGSAGAWARSWRSVVLVIGLPVLDHEPQSVALGQVFKGTAVVRSEVNAHRDRNPSVSYTHLRAHETVLDLVCRLLLEK